MKLSRRKFLENSVRTGAMFTLAANGIIPSILTAGDQHGFKICIFSKHLQWLDYTEMAETAARIGFNGIDLTVRPKGHVLPENALSDLPRAFEAVKNAGIETIMISTAIKSASDPKSRDILKTAGELGIPFYRMGWLKYNKSLSIKKNLEKIEIELQKLAEINQKYNIKGAYQNHAGDSFGSSIWDLGMILDKINSPYIGCQYDIRHATVEGANSWPVGFKYIAQHINTIDIKDFVWTNEENKWQVKNVPLGAGMVDFNRFFELLKNNKIQAPLSIHYEYDLGGAEHGASKIDIPADKIINIIQKDLDFIKQF